MTLQSISAKREQSNNMVLHEVANELPLCGIASSEGLGLKSDGIHFSSASYRILGERYFEVYKRLVD